MFDVIQINEQSVDLDIAHTATTDGDGATGLCAANVIAVLWAEHVHVQVALWHVLVDTMIPVAPSWIGWGGRTSARYLQNRPQSTRATVRFFFGE